MHTKSRAAIATVDRIALTPKTIRYAPSELRQIQHDHSYKLIPIEAIKTIRKFGLNRKRRRHLYTIRKRELNRNKYRQTKSNAEFLINVKKTSPYYNAKTIIGTCDIQSVKNKDLQITDLLTDYSLDLLAITETWLNDSPSTDR